MEGKIVAATFTTLAVVFAGMSGGLDAEVSEVNEVMPEQDSWINDFTSSFGLLDSLLENPEPEHHVTIEMTLSEDGQININSEEMHVEGLRTIEGGTQINSQEDLTLLGFNGNIDMGNETRIAGSMNGFKNSQMNVTSRISIDQEIDTELVQASGLERNAFELGAEEVLLESNETSSTIDQSNTIVEITSFSGDLEFRPPNQLFFDGKIAEVNAGQTSFGD